MSLETATFIDDLDSGNPTTTDTKSQGDDHLRLVKAVLKNSIKRVSRAFYVPGTLAKSANYSVLASDDNRTIICDTTVAFTLTLPALVAADAGWCVYVLKTTTDANPVFIAPPSGTISGYTKVRRSIENLITKVLWTGSVFVASRPNGGVIGGYIPFSTVAPVFPHGCVIPDGSTFLAADYVELNTALGGNTTKDLRGRALFGADNIGGSPAGRITTAGSGIDGVTLGAAGGAQSVVLVRANLPNVTLDTAIAVGQGSHAHTYNNTAGNLNNTGASGYTTSVGSGQSTGLTTLPAMVGTTPTGGSDTAVNKMPPAIIVGYAMVAE